MIFSPSGVGGVTAVKEEVAVPMDDHVLKVVKCGRNGGEAVLPKVVLQYLNAILARREGFADRNGRGIFFGKQEDVADKWRYMLESLLGDDVCALKGGGKPQMKSVVSRASQQYEVAADDG